MNLNLCKNVIAIANCYYIKSNNPSCPVIAVHSSSTMLDYAQDVSVIEKKKRYSNIQVHEQFTVVDQNLLDGCMEIDVRSRVGTEQGVDKLCVHKIGGYAAKHLVEKRGIWPPP